MENKSFFVYILESSDKKSTYVGATVDVQRRLKQHNGILKGGAKRTTGRLLTNSAITWNLICYVAGFPTWNCALKFEWRLKQLTRKLITSYGLNYETPLIRREMALEELMSFEKSTSSAIPFAEYPNKLKIVKISL